MMGKIKKEKNSVVVPEKRSFVEAVRKRKNVEKKKNSPEECERKYGYISANSVITMAESAGFSGIQEDVAKNLAEDVTYRLRFIVQQCKKYMMHSKHKKLSSSDINEVLKMCDIPSTYGYTVNEPLCNFVYVKEAEIFILEDNLIDLPSLVLTEIKVQQKPPLFAKGQWIKPEERSKVEIKSKQDELKSPNADMQDNNENLKHPSRSSAISENQKAGYENCENETKIPTNLIKYYGVTCNTILGHSDLKIIFQDLATSSSIVPIIPYLLNFITIALSKLGSDRQIKRLLQAIEALSKNQKIDFCPYSATTRVINAMLLIVAIDKKPAKISYDYHLRLYAGRVLSLVLSQWCFRDEQKTTIIKKMKKLLSDFNMSPKVHFGAIALLTALGPECLSLTLWQILKNFLGYLQELKHSQPNNKTGSDVSMLEEALLTAAVSLYKNYQLQEGIFLTELDRQLCSYFGDGLCNLWLHLLVNPKVINLQRLEIVRETEKTGLKTFKLINFRHKSKTKKIAVENVFSLTNFRKKGTKKIIFKFAGAIPVPEVNLRRKKLDFRCSKFSGGKDSEGRAIITGKCKRWRGSLWHCSPSLPVGCLFSIL